jgi:hypothetical protein
VQDRDQSGKGWVNQCHGSQPYQPAGWRRRRSAIREAAALRREVLNYFPEGIQVLKIDLLMLKWRKARQLEKRFQKKE